MADKSARAAGGGNRKPRISDGDGNHIHNQILLGLPLAEFEKVLPELEFVRLNTYHLLHDVGDTLKSVYFCNHGMISVLTVFPDGKSVEVGLVGKEGFVGLPLIAGLRTAYTRAVVQVEASAFRASADALGLLLPQCPRLAQALQQFSQVMAMETTQIAACNRVHGVEERLARWLLMCGDRVGDTSLPLTQELMAQMLGSRRASVTIAAGALQKAGLIRYTRGSISILNPAKLREAACECYPIMARQRKRWQNEKA